MKELYSHDLAGLDAATVTPFMLTLQCASGATSFQCRKLLRILPGRRQVIEAVRDGEAVVLKLFTGQQRARYVAREERGLLWLCQAGVPTAELLDRVHGEGVDGLVLRYLADARPVASSDQSHVEEVAHLIGRLHAAGIWQEDLHLDNFLRSEGQVHALDGDGVRHQARPLGLTAGLENLAVLAAQRPPREDPGADRLLAAYSQGRGQAMVSIEMFTGRLRKARARRVRRYLAKAQRSCTEFEVHRGWAVSTFAVRGRGEGPIARLLDDADRLFARSEVLKAGNSATVVRSQEPDSFVVKRFNVKSITHGLRRSLRPLPRYRRAWQSGQLLHFLQIPTARPIALLELRRRGLRDVAYLVQEDLGDRTLAAEVADSGLTNERCAEITELFALLKTAGIGHGDMKATNFLICDDRTHLIDLDAMRYDTRGFLKDLQRFLDNWRPAEKARFETSFIESGLIEAGWHKAGLI